MALIQAIPCAVAALPDKAWRAKLKRCGQVAPTPCRCSPRGRACPGPGTQLAVRAAGLSRAAANTGIQRGRKNRFHFIFRCHGASLGLPSRTIQSMACGKILHRSIN